MKIRNPFSNFSPFEWALWLGSIAVITISFMLGGLSDWLTLAVSLVGATSLIFIAKGDVIGQFLMIVFSIMYAVISYRQSYYGEMITFLGMTAPIATLSIVTWLRHPYEEGKREVAVSRLTKKSLTLMIVLACAVTVAFYFILDFFNTARLTVSTLSVTTSFIAAWLLMLRLETYALAYAANDIVIIVLWVLATLQDIACLPMVICFSIFFINDTYGYYNWRRMKKRQATDKDKSSVSEQLAP